MKSVPNVIAEILLGSLGILGSLTLQEWAAVSVAAVTILAMLPLVFWRWRNLLTGRRPPGK